MRRDGPCQARAGGSPSEGGRRNRCISAYDTRKTFDMCHLPREQVMSPHDLIGTASYVLLAVSYMVTNIYWLRLLAIIALTAEAIYFYMAGDSALWVGILWAGIFN